MFALVLEDDKPTLKYREVSTPLPASGEVLVELKASALNHRDVWITKGRYPNIDYPCILGSDGAGVAEGGEVILNPGIHWGDDPRFQSANYRILGLPHPGTFATHISVPAQNLIKKPDHLTLVQAAALPLAGVTAYRALFTRARLQPGERVLISGIGGGVALLAFQFALAAGAEVFVTSSSEKKIDKARALGAKGGVLYNEPQWGKKFAKTNGGFDLIVDSAGGEGFKELMYLPKPGGRIVLYGGTRGLINKLSPQIIFWKQLSILGSTMGNDQDFADMIAFVEKHQIVPVVDSIFDLAEGAKAFQRMEKGLQFGKIVLLN